MHEVPKNIPSKHFVLPEKLDALDEINEALTSGWLSSGPYTRRLEETVGDAFDRHAISASSAMDALEIVFEHIGLEGRDVYLAANAFQAIPSMVIASGGYPIALPIRKETHCADLTSLLGSPPAILVHIHSYGVSDPYDLMLLQELSDKGWWVVVDSANLLPDYNYCKASVQGDHIVEILSFNPTKAIASAKGAILLTSDTGLAKHAKAFRSHSGAEPVWLAGGHIYRDRQIGEINAIIAYHQWMRRHDIRDKYALLHSKYETELQARADTVSPALALSFTVPTRFPVTVPEDVDIFNLSAVMKNEGVGCSIMYGTPWTDLKGFLGTPDTCNVTRRLIARTICLPLHEALDRNDIDFIIEKITHTLPHQRII